MIAKQRSTSILARKMPTVPRLAVYIHDRMRFLALNCVESGRGDQRYIEVSRRRPHRAS